MSMLLAFGAPGWMELSIIAGIILLLFGGSKLPTLMRNMGRGVTEFKKGLNSNYEDEESVAGEEKKEDA